jgi:hypothetical protein
MANITDNDRVIMDGLCRLILLDWLKQSKYDQSEVLENYIIREASYQQVVLAVVEKKSFFKEDASNRVKLAKIENDFTEIFAIGGAILAGGTSDNTIRKLIKRLFPGGVSMTSKDKPKFKSASKIIRGAGRTAWAITPVVSLFGLTWGFALLSKATFSYLRNTMSKCRKTCQKKYANSTIDYKPLTIEICSSDCKIIDFKKTVSKLRSEISKCDSPKIENPDRCKGSLTTMVGKLVDLEKKELKRNITLKRKLREKIIEKRKRDNK